MQDDSWQEHYNGKFMLRRTGLILLLAAMGLAGAPNDWLLPNFADRLEVQLTNPSNSEVRTLAVIPVPQAAQTALGFPGSLAIAVILSPAGSQYPITIVPSQADDLDGDGTPDEFVFPVQLAAHETRQAHIYFSTTLRDHMVYPKRVHAEHNYGYNHATVALESEQIGYRTYGGFFLDIQARAAGQPGLYNNFVGYLGSGRPSMAGRDIIHLGNTLGLGGIFLRQGSQVFRPPLNMPDYAHKPSPVEAPHYRVIADGPVRAVVEARMDRWTIGEDEVSLRAVYSIAADTSYVQCQIHVAALHMADGHTYEIGTGLRHLPDLKLSHAPGRLMLSGTQEAKVGPLAMALFHAPSDAALAEPLSTRDDRNEIVVFGDRLRAGRAVDVRYQVAAAWSGSGIANLFEHLEQVEKQARGTVQLDGFKLTHTPLPARIEGEAN
jgi:hypothetical protein